MGRDLLISVHPIHVAAMRSGRKTVELRRVRPAIEPGCRVVFYETAPISAVIAWATVAAVHRAPPIRLWRMVGANSACLRTDFLRYYADREIGFAIAFHGFRLLPRPVSRGSLARRLGSFHPPQSYRYLDRSRVDDRRLLSLLALPQPARVASRTSRRSAAALPKRG
ncbi:MAG TPA: hypothetical protein VF777_06030 [Phycisphaerales bacterium]